jgi:hypothetical protein
LIEALVKESQERVVFDLIGAVKAWQAVLDQELSEYGIDYAKWVLLRAIVHGEFVRHETYLGPLRITAHQSEDLLAELHAAGWVAFTSEPPKPEPFVPQAAMARVARVSQAVRALHSVSVAALDRQDRGMLSALLQRMTSTLHEHHHRKREQGRALEFEAPLFVHAAHRVPRGGPIHSDRLHAI